MSIQKKVISLYYRGNVVIFKTQGCPVSKILLCLDLDGTVVMDREPLSEKMCEFLEKCHTKGCTLLFATGRTVTWSLETLSVLSFPFFLAAYNGACTISCPERKIMRSAFLSPSDLNPIIPFVDRYGALIYEGGGEERVFYTPSLFSEEIFTHLTFRKEQQREEWHEITSLHDLPCPLIASVRLFLFEDDDADEISTTIEEKTSLCAPLMKDVFCESVHVVQVTASGASKGQALQALRREHPSLLSIAAGDDMNDLDMLRAADFGIAMPYAPLRLREMAHAVAPSFGEDPLIEPLQRVMERMQEGEERR